MKTCCLPAPVRNLAGEFRRFRRSAAAFPVFLFVLLSAGALSPAPATADDTPRSFALADTNDLTVTGGKAEPVEYQGRKSVHLTTEKGEVFAFLKGIQFQDGVIETDLALKTTTAPGVRNPGFLGIAFRASNDASHYEMFYVRPGNSISPDQAMRNHSVQYVSAPGNDWYKLRRQWPWVYESWAELRPETWARIRIEVHGRSAKLYVNGSKLSSLVVDGMTGEDLSGGVALWSTSGEEAYFSNVTVTPGKAEPVTNGGEASGTWDVKFSSDYGPYQGTMNLHREGSAVTGTWSGDFGKELSVTGSWRNGYIELAFSGTWTDDKPVPVNVALAGWIDGDAAKGRMTAIGRADGPWSATRKSRVR